MNETNNTNHEVEEVEATLMETIDPNDLLTGYDPVPLGGSGDVKVPIIQENPKTSIYILNTVEAGEMLDKIFNNVVSMKSLTEDTFPFDENDIAEGKYLTSGEFVHLFDCTPVKIVGEEEREEDTPENDMHLYVYPYMEMRPIEDEPTPLATFEDENGDPIEGEEPKEYAHYMKRIFIMGDSVLCHWSDKHYELLVVKEKLTTDVFHIVI